MRGERVSAWLGQPVQMGLRQPRSCLRRNKSGNSESAAVPGRLVCRISADADPHHSYHPNHEDPVHREPRKFTALVVTTVIICAVGMSLPFTWAGAALGFCSASPAVLAAGRCYACDIRDANPRNERLVHSQGGALRWGPQSWFEDLSPTRPQPLNFFQKNPALPAEEVSDFKRDVPHPDRLGASDSGALLIA